MLKNKILKNASWIIGCKIIQSIIGLIVSMLTARYLGPSNYGIISYAASIIAFFTPIMQLGLTNIIVQEIVSNPEEEGTILGTAIIMSVISAVGCIFGVFVFTLVVNTSEIVTIIVCVLYSLSLIAQALELTQYWFQAKYKSKYTSLSSLAAYILVSAYQIFLLIEKKEIYWFAITYTLQYGIIAFLLIILYIKNRGQKFNFSIETAKRLFSKSKYYIVSSLMVTVFAQTDKIMLKMMVDDAATGYYSAAVTCSGLSYFVFQAIIDSARPAIFEAQLKSKEQFEKNISRLYCVVIYLSLLQCIVMTGFAGLIIHILYGKSYSASIPALRLIVWYTTFSYLGVIRNIWILAEQKQRYLWQINLFGAVANVGLNALLIPYYGIMGAAFASLFTQFFTNVIVGFIIRPIRFNNTLMARGMNPKLLLDFIPQKMK